MIVIVVIDGNIHQIFVCDKTKDNKLKPLAMITQRDLIRFVLYMSGCNLSAIVV